MRKRKRNKEEEAPWNISASVLIFVRLLAKTFGVRG
jgi:hypothetical protein